MATFITTAVLRRVFRPRRDEVTGGQRKLHIEKLSDLCSSPNIIRIIKSRRGACSMNEGEERVCIIGGKAREKETTRKTKT
jgi:hypothetical protein